MGILFILEEECMFFKVNDNIFKEKLYVNYMGKFFNFGKFGKVFKFGFFVFYFELYYYVGSVSFLEYKL